MNIIPNLPILHTKKSIGKFVFTQTYLYSQCKCNKGILKNLFNPFSSNAQVNLTAGSLALRDAKVLGRLGNILVLSKFDKDRIYFICINSIGFFGPSL